MEKTHNMYEHPVVMIENIKWNSLAVPYDRKQADAQPSQETNQAITQSLKSWMFDYSKEIFSLDYGCILLQLLST